MEAHIKYNDKKLFYKFLDKSSEYFEFGAGGSTYQAAIRPHINRIISVESDIEWIDKIKKTLPSNHKIDFKYIECMLVKYKLNSLKIMTDNI